jgi:hypothetical protein
MSGQRTPPGFDETPSLYRWPKRSTGDIGIKIPQPNKSTKTLYVPLRKRDMYSLLRRYGGFTTRGAETLTSQILKYFKKSTKSQHELKTFTSGMYFTKPYNKSVRKEFGCKYPTHVSVFLQKNFR